jgi:predicted dehydrogenase
MLRGAIIGLGNIAMKGHIPAFIGDEVVSSKLKIEAVVDIVEANLEQAAKQLPGVKLYTNIDSMLDLEKLDFVDICSPPHTHAEYIRLCGAKGLHVICEKPLTEKYETSRDLSKFIQESKIVFVPCHQYKYSPLWKTIHDVIKSGEIGDVTVAQFNVFRLQADTGTAGWNPGWRTSKDHSGGGILVDTGAHYFYLAQYFFSMPLRVDAVLRTLKHQHYGVEDTAIVTLEYDKMLMQINLTWAAGERANSVFVAGTNGSLSYNGVKLLLSNASGTKELPMPNVADKNQYVSWYASLFKEFHKRIEGRNYSTDLFDEAMNVMKLLNISYYSSNQQSMIECT